jgi:ABC-type lipoprotein release transport system permease subunit
VSGLKNGASLSVQELNDAVRRVWDLEDIGLNVRVLADGKTVELRSRRVFLEQPIVEAAFKAFPDAKGTFTYLVNAIRHDDMTTPYSFVSAPGEPVVAADMADDEIIVNEWLAEDLDLKPSDSVALSYYVMGKGRTLEEKTASFKVRSVVPLGGPATDRELMPSFPGLSDSGYCRDWDTGIPISLGKIRTKDEDYWNQYRGTPKAFVTLPAAQTMWRNRFGALTSIRCSGQTVEDVSNAIRRALTPPAVGLLFRPVKEEGLKAVGQSVDFGQLFVGLSGFILVAALILMALLFAFGVERRMEERGLLLALGFSSRRVVLFLLAEGIVLATAGAVLGVAGGILYNQLVLRELASVWKGAIGVLPLTPHVEPVTLIVGAVSGIMVAVLAMGWVLWKQAGFSISVLQSGHGRCEEKCAIRRSRIVSALAAACFLGALATATLAGHGKDKEPSGIFFGVGALMLVGSLMMCHGLLTRMAAPMTTHRLSLVLVGCRNIARRRGRSLATIGLLACGIFVVFAVGANRQDVLRDADRRESGTGGFALIGETTIPIVHALNDDKVRRQLGLDGAEMAGVRFVQIRVKDGDDASCLNLNRAQNVRILGVNPREFDDRGSFRFSETGKRANPVRPWLLLNSPDSAVADQTVITWGLGKSVGGVHSYENDQGSVREVKFMAGLSGSLFQGSILLSEDRFCEDFPSVSGYRMFLADVPSGKEAAVERTLRRVFENYGLDLVPASRRLAEFSIVENTYLAIFLALGGLGLMLGSLGVGIVVFRNVQDRRRELAVLRAVGFSRRSLQWVIVSEHLVLLMAGLVFGVVSAVVAILPTLMRSAVEAPKTLMIGLVLALFLCGVFWTWLAASFAARGDLLPALREE